MSETIVLISTITALCSVVLSPLVSMWIVQKQSRVSVLSGNRQAWINSLRDQVSEFIAILAAVNSGSWSSRTVKEFEEELKQLIFAGSKIKLMLNIKEDDHKKLSGLIGEVGSLFSNRTDNDNKKKRCVEIVGELVPLVQSILKREWERVKQSE